MSNIPRARELLHEVESMTDLLQIRRQVRRAIGLMTREPACRHAPSKPIIITPKVREHIRSLRHTKLTIHEIANRTGVRNTGRVSEVLNGKR